MWEMEVGDGSGMDVNGCETEVRRRLDNRICRRFFGIMDVIEEGSKILLACTKRLATENVIF